MLKSLIVGLCAAVFLLAAVGKDDPMPTPLFRAVTPDTAAAGDTLTMTGENLDKARVAEVYLTSGQDNFKMQILTQAADKITAKIPANVKLGRLRLMVLTAGLEPKFLEQPVVVEIR